jgi:hypothetical protein
MSSNASTLSKSPLPAIMLLHQGLDEPSLSMKKKIIVGCEKLMRCHLGLIHPKSPAINNMKLSGDQAQLATG